MPGYRNVHNRSKDTTGSVRLFNTDNKASFTQLSMHYLFPCLMVVFI